MKRRVLGLALAGLVLTSIVVLLLRGRVSRGPASPSPAAGEAARQAFRARAGMGLWAAGAGIAVLGLAGVLFLWYQKGKEGLSLPTGGLLPTPPSELPPALVAYLVDGEAGARGVLAELLNLAERGLALVVWHGEDLRLVRVRRRPSRRREYLRLLDGDRVRRGEHERALFYAILGGTRQGEGVALSGLGERFLGELPKVYAQMAAEGRRYFVLGPEAARRIYVGLGVWLMALAAATALVALLTGRAFALAAFAPSAGFATVGLAVTLASRALPRQAPILPQEVARWRAFGRYLASLERQGDPAMAREALNRHFGYAIALGVGEEMVRQAARLGAEIPSWSLLPGSELLAAIGEAGGGVSLEREAEGGQGVLLRDGLPGEGEASERADELLIRSLGAASQRLAQLLERPWDEALGGGLPEGAAPRLRLDAGGMALVLVAPGAIPLREILREILATLNPEAGAGI